jgi:hypothetical protein
VFANLLRLEQVEGCQFIELNKERIQSASRLVQLQLTAQQLIADSHVAPCGTRLVRAGLSSGRVCIAVDQEAFRDMLLLIKAYKGHQEPKYSMLSWASVESFAKMLCDRFSQIANADAEFYQASLLEATADVYDSCELYMGKIFDQMILLHKRLEKFLELKQLGTGLTDLDLAIVAQSLAKEIEANYQKDIQDVRDLIKELDAAEHTSQTLLETLHSEDRWTTTLTREQFKEAGQLMQFIIKVRKLQADIEETIPELAAEKEREMSKAPVDEE